VTRAPRFRRYGAGARNDTDFTSYGDDDDNGDGDGDGGGDEKGGGVGGGGFGDVGGDDAYAVRVLSGVVSMEGLPRRRRRNDGNDDDDDVVDGEDGTSGNVGGSGGGGGGGGGGSGGGGDGGDGDDDWDRVTAAKDAECVRSGVNGNGVDGNGNRGGGGGGGVRAMVATDAPVPYVRALAHLRTERRAQRTRLMQRIQRFDRRWCRCSCE
jgi:hypothetical protein